MGGIKNNEIYIYIYIYYFYFIFLLEEFRSLELGAKSINLITFSLASKKFYRTLPSFSSLILLFSLQRLRESFLIIIYPFIYL